MNAYDRSYERIKAVQKSAELLRDLGTAFFPLDVFGALSAFGKQINLVQYADLKKSAETKASDSDIPEVTPQMMSKDGFCTRVPNFLFDTGVSGSVWYIYYDDSIRESRIRFTLMHELGHIMLRHHQLLHADTLIGLDAEAQKPCGMGDTVQNVCSRCRMSVHPMAGVLTPAVIMTGIAVSAGSPRSTSSLDG